MDIGRAVCAAAIAVLAHSAQAAPQEHREDQVCGERVLALADTFLQASGKRQGSDDAQPAFASACKAWPGKEPYILGVFIYDGLEQDTKRMLVALLDQEPGKAVASYWSAVPADALLRYTDGIRIDTARYQLRPDLRAFGVDITTYAPRYDNGGSNPVRTLFVREGASIRPVLSNMAVSRWYYMSDPWASQNEEDPVDPEIQRYDYTISIAATRSKGFADLLITRKSNHFEAKPQTQLLHYDGKQYPEPHE